MRLRTPCSRMLPSVIIFATHSRQDHNPAAALGRCGDIILDIAHYREVRDKFVNTSAPPEARPLAYRS
jgi:hypothetical protein